MPINVGGGTDSDPEISRSLAPDAADSQFWTIAAAFVAFPVLRHYREFGIVAHLTHGVAAIIAGSMMAQRR
jgi:hypothetical protein